MKELCFVGWQMEKEGCQLLSAFNQFLEFQIKGSHVMYSFLEK